MTDANLRTLDTQEIDAVAGGFDFIPLGPFVPGFPQPTVCPPPPRFEELALY
jgi:hypothetical protein